MNATPTPPRPDDRHDLVPLLPAPAPRDLPGGRHRQLREFLLTEINAAPRRERHSSPGRRFGLAIASAAAVAVVVAAAVGAGLWFGHGATPSGGQSRAGAESTTTTGTPYTPPRADQWIYVSNHVIDTSAIGRDKGVQPDVTQQSWKRVDGTQMAGVNDITGNLDTWDQASDYPFLAALPTDPGALLDALRAHEEQATQWPPADRSTDAPLPPHPIVTASIDELVGEYIVAAFEQYVLPPDLAGALWQTLALLPGVTQEPGTVTVGGHVALAATWIEQGWQSVRFYVDPDTHAFVGSETTASADYTFDTPTGPLTEKAGSALWSIQRLAAGIVDKPGDTV